MTTKTMESRARERKTFAAGGGNPPNAMMGPRDRRAGAKAGSGTRARPRAALSKERILAEALQFVDERGLAGFTTRRLGERLGCEAMSIYHHFPSKQRLLDALAEHVCARIVEPPTDLDPIARLRVVGGEFLALARRHPWLFPLIAVQRADIPAGVAIDERLLRDCRALLSDDHLATQACRILRHYLTGAALDETAGYAAEPGTGGAAGGAQDTGEYSDAANAAPSRMAPHVAGTFELGFEMILEGIAVLRARQPAATTPRPKPIVRPKH